ncbi:MAG: hypothetical protein ACK4X1_03310 [Terricaulis sp.]
MKQYPIWLTGFGVGLVVPAILEVLIYEGGNGIAFGFGILILIAIAARAIFARRENDKEPER